MRQTVALPHKSPLQKRLTRNRHFSNPCTVQVHHQQRHPDRGSPNYT